MIAKAVRWTGSSAMVWDWDEPPWREVPSERLRNHMGQMPDPFPAVEVKIAYDNDAIFIMFRVADQYVRAVAAEHQDSVCGDSCVEFFFTPGSDVTSGYFNVEMNCGGVMLFHFNSEVRRGMHVIPKADCAKIVKVHSLSRMIDPEIREPVTWTVGYAVPMALLRRYCPVTSPAPHVIWRVNFYKCADNTSHPHWLTWVPVDYPKPNFHLPRSFGILEFNS